MSSVGKLVTVDHWNTVIRIEWSSSHASPSDYPKEGIGVVTYYIPSIHFPVSLGDTFTPSKESA